jgi:ribosomal protein S18 acetylase RimI-like enzyme
MSQFQFRPSNANDIPYLKKLDLVCHEEEPASRKWWEDFLANPQGEIIVAAQEGSPVAVIVWQLQVEKIPGEQNRVKVLHVNKICVHPEYRHQGVGRYLMAHAHEYAAQKRCSYISISAPEYYCQPGDPYDVSVWLNKLGFKSTIILPHKVHIYGKLWDQFLFVYDMK